MERIDTIATALHAGFTVDRLIDLDLSYAPPFSPVWDPVQIAAKKKSRSDRKRDKYQSQDIKLR